MYVTQDIFIILELFLVTCREENNDNVLWIDPKLLDAVLRFSVENTKKVAVNKVLCRSQLPILDDQNNKAAQLLKSQAEKCTTTT